MFLIVCYITVVKYGGLLVVVVCVICCTRYWSESNRFTLLLLTLISDYSTGDQLTINVDAGDLERMPTTLTSRHHCNNDGQSMLVFLASPEPSYGQLSQRSTTPCLLRGPLFKQQPEEGTLGNFACKGYTMTTT